MMPLTPSTPAVRDPKALRARVDAKLGSGGGMSMAEARALLSPAERMEWALGECLISMLDKRFHIWVQGWCLEGPVDGPAVIAAIAEAARPLDEVVADLLRWTSNRGRWARTGERPDALISVVPEVWHGAWDRVVPFAHTLSAAWPEEVDPFALPAPAPWTRGPRRGKIRVEYPVLTPDGVLESTAHALWAGGATEDELDAFFQEAGRLPEILPRYVAIEPAELEALRLALNPPDPLAGLLGVEKLKFPSLGLLPAAREAELLEAAKSCRHVVLEAPLLQAARTALRRDPDLLVARTQDVTAGDVEILLSALQTGHLLILHGEATAEVEGLAATAASFGTPVLRP